MSSEEGEHFEWHKKRQQERLSGLPARQLAESEAARRAQNSLDLERIKRRRLEREAEVESQKAAKLASSETAADWQERERRFNLEQLYQKAFLRVKEKRAELFDLLALNTFRKELIISTGHVSGVEKAFWFAILVDEPVKALDAKDRGRLDGEVRGLLELETDPQYIEYWKAILQYSTMPPRKPLTDDLVREEIKSMLSDKTYQQLAALELKITTTHLLSDVDYREEVLSELRHRKVTTRIRELNRTFLERLKSEYTDGEFEELTLHSTTAFSAEVAPPMHAGKWDQSPAAIALYSVEAHRSVGQDEVPFNVEAEDVAKPASYSWSATHRPRKPRYFNRARASYEWNKYNQTHYDSENPPPKTLQGFRFNIFYPELVDLAHTPEYRIEDDLNGDESTKLLWFTAGAPYEDLVFRIPNSEWEFAPRHGFRCTFDRGALRLHFWFRKQRVYL